MDLPNIDTFIKYGGQINIGSHPPVGCIAVANIEGDTLAMLKCGPDEKSNHRYHRLASIRIL